MALPERVPPQNIEAEQAVLGAMMIKKEAIVEAQEILQPEDFYREAHRRVYDAMLKLAENDEAVDLVTLTEQLRKVQADAANKTMAINREADTRVETERIRADAATRVAEINKASEKELKALEDRLAGMIKGLENKLAEQQIKPEEESEDK